MALLNDTTDPSQGDSEYVEMTKQKVSLPTLQTYNKERLQSRAEKKGCSNYRKEASSKGPPLESAAQSSCYQSCQEESAHGNFQSLQTESIYEEMHPISRIKEDRCNLMQGQFNITDNIYHQPMEASYEKLQRKMSARIYQSLQKKDNSGNKQERVATNESNYSTTNRRTSDSLCDCIPECKKKGKKLSSANIGGRMKSRSKWVKIAVTVVAVVATICLTIGIAIGTATISIPSNTKKIQNISTNSSEALTVPTDSKVSNISTNSEASTISTNSEASTVPTDSKVSIISTSPEHLNIPCSGMMGSWRRVAHFDFRNNVASCPQKLRYNFQPPSCIRSVIQAGCTSVILFPSNSTQYSRVCGRLQGLQRGSVDGFMKYSSLRRSSILHNNYVDGVVLTYQQNPRRHIWTFAASNDAHLNRNNTILKPCSPCDCNRPFFLNPSQYSCSLKPQCSDIQCHIPEWSYAFNRELPRPTTGRIEMRVCRDEDRENEDILITLIDLYIL